MNAENYLKIHIGKLYRYDKKPKYFTEQMVVELMEGYAHHKIKQLDSDNTSLYFSLLDTVNELRKSKEAIFELEKDLRESQKRIDLLLIGIKWARKLND